MRTRSSGPEKGDASLHGGVLVIQALLLVGAAGLGTAWHIDVVDLHDPLWLRPLCAFLVVLYGWSMLSWRLRAGVWFDTYTIFLSAAFVFNAGQAMLEAFRLNPRGILEGRFSLERILDAHLLVTLALIGMHTGALLATVRRRRGPEDGVITSGGPSSREVREVGWGLLTIAFPATVITLAGAIQTVLASGYMALYSREVSVGVFALPQILGAFLVPAALFLLAGSTDSRLGRYVSGLVLIINAVCQLYLGTRYYAAMPLVAYAWVWHRCIRPLPTVPIMALLAFVLVVVFPTVRYTREVSGEQRTLDAIVEKYTSLDNPALQSLGEMGGTSMILMYTMELIPATRDFDYGLTYFYALLTLMPNVAWDLHPSIAYGTPSHWLIWAVEPWLASRGGSFGFSFIAEAYLSFGWAGTPWILGLFGYGFARLTLWAQQRGGLVPAKVAMVASCINFVAFYAREEAAVIVRPLVWYSLLPFAMVYLLAWGRAYFGRATRIRVAPGGTV